MCPTSRIARDAADAASSRIYVIESRNSMASSCAVFFSSRRRHTKSVSAFLLNRSSDLWVCKLLMLICILTKNVITSCSVTMMLFLHLEVKPLMTLTTVLYLSCALISGHLAMMLMELHNLLLARFLVVFNRPINILLRVSLVLSMALCLLLRLFVFRLLRLKRFSTLTLKVL